MSSKNEKIIKEFIVGKKYEDLANIANLPKELQPVILNAKQNNLSLSALRIMLLIAANLNGRQMYKKHQLSLFDEEWMEINESSFVTQFSFHYSDFLPKGSKNYKPITDGLLELKQYETKVKLEKVDGSGKVRSFDLYSSILSDIIFEKNVGFKFSMNAYWYKMFLNISSSYSKFVKEIAISVSSVNSLIFYFYLKGLPLISTGEYRTLFKEMGGAAVRSRGTKVSLERLNQIFMTDYKYFSKFEEKILKPVRAELNSYSDISFNYKKRGKLVYIISYETRNELGVYSSTAQQIRSAINYKIKRHGLNELQSRQLMELYLKYSYDIVTKSTARKPSLKGLEGDNFMEAFHALVMKYFEKSGIDINKIHIENKEELRRELLKSYSIA
ncbi:replication initiation protein [Parapedobacter sp. 10938]|uniref:replication initiation protein n=1 Tax=Parapedobacter flavus TaxID=3110225 RepID=UPI002DB88FD4|nr:replication initiation protein [Parapedobacter sp. 10938]MEC3881836.1 replication initiation protein [Parapedobacter sp. 10938]